MNVKKIGPIGFHTLTITSAVEKTVELIEMKNHCYQIIIANAYSLVLAKKTPEFHHVCQNADIVFADGQSVVWASILLGERLPARVAGPDFMWSFCSMSAGKKYKHFLLGGRSEYLELLKNRMINSFPEIQITGTYSPPFGEWNDEENEKIVSLINESKADVLWVGISTPKQDIWIDRFKNKLTVKVALGVGAAFDFHAGRIKRAPKLLQSIGLEWLYRLSQDPKRLWRRYLIGNIQFLGILLEEIIRKVRRK